MMITTPTRRPAKVGVSVGNVPEEAGAAVFLASAPAIPSNGTIIMKRPINIASPSVVLYQGVLAVRPANAEPLLPVADANAYRISLNPCGPALFKLPVGAPYALSLPP